jgi:hypothetical protein
MVLTIYPRALVPTYSRKKSHEFKASTSEWHVGVVCHLQNHETLTFQRRSQFPNLSTGSRVEENAAPSLSDLPGAIISGLMLIGSHRTYLKGIDVAGG